MKLGRAWLVPVVLALAACGGGQQPDALPSTPPAAVSSPPPAAEPATQPVAGAPGPSTPFQVIAHGSAPSLLPAEATVALRDATAVAAFMSDLGLGTTDLPAVDFQQSDVLALHLGSRSLICFGVEVTRVTDSPGERLVHYRENSPCPAQPCGTLPATPFQLVAIARSTAPVQFVQEATKYFGDPHFCR